MEIRELNKQEFLNIFAQPYFIYGGAEFTELNKDNAEKIYYLAFWDKKYRLGISVGVKDNSLYSPFSAPFGGFIFANNNIKLNYIDNAIEELIRWSQLKKLDSINLTLPPTFYHNSFIQKQINSLYRNNFVINQIDLNYHYNSVNFADNYFNKIMNTAKNKLKIALSNNLRFKKCELDEEKLIVYQIIKENRSIRGFPLRLTWEKVNKTSEIIPADFFIVLDQDNKSIASAIAFHVSAEIVQIIYWGDIPKYSNLKPMNFLSYKIFEYYSNKGIKIIDVGPSTENSEPNYGLCVFKESIGCDVEIKLTLIKTI